MEEKKLFIQYLNGKDPFLPWVFLSTEETCQPWMRVARMSLWPREFCQSELWFLLRTTELDWSVGRSYTDIYYGWGNLKCWSQEVLGCNTNHQQLKWMKRRSHTWDIWHKPGTFGQRATSQGDIPQIWVWGKFKKNSPKIQIGVRSESLTWGFPNNCTTKAPIT